MCLTATYRPSGKPENRGDYHSRGIFGTVFLSTTISWIERKMLVDMLIYFDNLHYLAMSTITFPDLQTLKIKKKIVGNIPHDW